MKRCIRQTGHQVSALGGFTLVEVVLALGILAFSVITVLGLFGSLNKRATETIERRAAVGAMDALSNYLRHERDFATAFQWAKNGTKELAFVRYRANSAGQPVASGGTQVRASWLEIPVASEADYEAAREGRWMGARLKPSPNLNPVAPASLPASAASYNRDSLIFDVDMFIVPDPDIFPATAPILSGAVAARKP